nr:MAG TPA: hypothetical protein [Caudoviricetes sp.]
MIFYFVTLMLSINHKETINSDYPIITLMLSIVITPLSQRNSQ